MLCDRHQLVLINEHQSQNCSYGSQTRIIFVLMSLGIPGRSIVHYAHDSQGQSKGCKTFRPELKQLAHRQILLHTPCAFRV